MHPVNAPPEPRPLLAIFKLVLIALLIIAANYAFDHFRQTLEFDIRPSNEDTVHRLIMMAAVFYVIALAIPFVPGIEIGIGLMAVLGVKIVPLVYFCTVAGLVLAFVVGRIIPTSALIRISRDLHLTRTAAMLQRQQDLPVQDRLSLLISGSSSRFARFLLRHRYFAVAAVINLPGNFVIGGGGGIAVISGASGLFRLPLFALTVAIAVAPVPLAILIFGPSILSQ